MLDGDIDYSRHTREQLEDVLRNINADRFPLNFANALKSYQALEQPAHARHRQKSYEATPRQPARLNGRVAAVAKYVAIQFFAMWLTNLVGVIAFRAFSVDANSGAASVFFNGLAVLTAFLVFVVLAKRHPQGYFVTASAVAVCYFLLSYGMASLSGPPAKLGISQFIVGLVGNVGLAVIAGLFRRRISHSDSHVQGMVATSRDTNS